MTSNEQLRFVSIQPTSGVLGVLAHLNYKAWYALAEFVDNAIQSYHDYEESLKSAHAGDYRLSVVISWDTTTRTLSVTDNAAGIHEVDFQRALQLAAVPPDRSGLSEFGMGMKSAACWFCGESGNWTLETSALGESVKRSVHLDIARIISDTPDKLDILQEQAEPHEHYTRLTMRNIANAPATKTFGKIKNHLSSIYRRYLIEGDLFIECFGNQLSRTHVEILRAPDKSVTEGPEVEWRKDINFMVGDVPVRGFGGIRARASTSDAGFAIFRRKRLIVGSEGDGYRPEEIFGKSNSYRYQRVFGELDIENLSVTHTKDGLQWDESQELEFIEKLKMQLDSPELPILRQAELYRAKEQSRDVRTRAKTIIRDVGAELQSGFESALTSFETSRETPETPDTAQLEGVDVAPGQSAVFTFSRGAIAWEVTVAFVHDRIEAPWLHVGQAYLSNDGPDAPHTLRILMSTHHPFVQRFLDPQGKNLEPMSRMAASVGLAEVIAKFTGYEHAGMVREFLEGLLRTAFSGVHNDQEVE